MKSTAISEERMSRFHKRQRAASHIAEKRRLSGGSMRCGKSAGALQTDGRAVIPGQAPCVFDQFQEMDFGAFEGHNCEELKADVRYQAWIDSNGTLPFPQRESREQFQRRCVEGFFVSCLRKCGRGRGLCRRLRSSCTAERSWRFWKLLRRAVITTTSAQMRRDTKGRLSVEFDVAGNVLRDTIKIADVRKLEE